MAQLWLVIRVRSQAPLAGNWRFYNFKCVVA